MKGNKKLLNSVLAKVDQNLDESVKRLFDLLSIPSISTDPQYAKYCVDAAQWLIDDLRQLGFETQLCKTTGHPIVLAHQKSTNLNVPHVLFYGHYDVQPVDPIELWDSDPFIPQLKDKDGHKVIVARGSSDDKGQLMTFIEACRAYKEVTGTLPVHVTIMLEGEEESGSPSIPEFLAQYKDQLKADIALICDTSMWDRQSPSISIALRGMMAEEVKIYAANRDLHSGEFGGAAANPLRILSKILGELFDENNRITLSGFYDGVEDVPAEILQTWQKLEQERNILHEIGLNDPAGEKGRGILESVWARPTLEINGLSGGYTQEGFKTVIPAEASVKISCRLVGKQDPLAIQASFRQFVQDRIPADCRVEFISHGTSPACVVPLDETCFLQAAQDALAAEWSKETLLLYCGGSIPIVGDFQNELNMSSLLIGFALDDDAIHSPNEKYDLNSFHKGQRSWIRILNELAKGTTAHEKR